MKTKLLALLMFVSFGILCGQTINLDQTGDGHLVKIHQIGDNTINIEQSEYKQSVSIYQKGELNLVNILQNIQEEGRENNATITQIGNENISGIEQDGGISNDGEIGQYGDRNIGIITQSGGEMFSNGINTAIIFQQGDDNEGAINQVVYYHEAQIIQKGNFNKAEITMTGSDFHDFNNTALINQEGMNNYALQTMGSAAVHGTILQAGDNNSAVQNLNANGNYAGSYGEIIQRQNNAEAKQKIGDTESHGKIYQFAMASGASNYNEQYVYSEEGLAIANVYDGGNYGTQKLTGRVDFSQIEQEGKYNITEMVLQTDYNSSYAQTRGMNSSYNNISIHQIGDWLHGGGNSATILIEGSFNDASITQDGWENKAGVTNRHVPYTLPFGIEIIGDYNEASLLQQGDNNSADLHLLGNNLELNIEQTGNNMTASITQEN